jgi:hypothetical protein
MSGGLDAKMYRIASQALPDDGYAQKTADEKARETAYMDNAGRQGQGGNGYPTAAGAARQAEKVDGGRRWIPEPASVANPRGFRSPGELLAYNTGRQLAETAANKAVYDAQKGITADAMAFDVTQQAALLGDTLAQEPLEEQQRKVREWLDGLGRNPAYSPSAAATAEDRIARMNLLSGAARQALSHAQRQGLEVAKSQTVANFQSADAGIRDNIKKGGYASDPGAAYRLLLPELQKLRPLMPPHRYLDTLNKTVSGLAASFGEYYLSEAEKSGDPVIGIAGLEKAYGAAAGVGRGIVDEQVRRMNLGEAGEQYGQMYDILSGEGLDTLKEAAAKKNFAHFSERQARFTYALARGDGETARRIAELYAPRMEAAYRRGDITPELFGQGAGYFRRFWKDGESGRVNVAGEADIGDESVKRISHFLKNGSGSEDGYGLNPAHAKAFIIQKTDPEGEIFKTDVDRDIYATTVLTEAYLRQLNNADKGLHSVIETGLAQTVSFVKSAANNFFEQNAGGFTPEQRADREGTVKDLSARISRVATAQFIETLTNPLVSPEGVTAKQLEKRYADILSGLAGPLVMMGDDSLFGTVDILESGEPGYKSDGVRRQKTAELFTHVYDYVKKGGSMSVALSDNPSAQNAARSGGLNTAAGEAGGLIRGNDDLFTSNLAEFAGTALGVDKNRITIVELPGEGIFARVYPPEPAPYVSTDVREPEVYSLEPSRDGHIRLVKSSGTSHENIDKAPKKGWRLDTEPPEPPYPNTRPPVYSPYQRGGG